MERIGVFGGTFDPIHIGHLINAYDARQDLNLDKVLFVVANEPWQKNTKASAFDRLCMADLAVHEIPWAEVSTVDIDRGGVTRSIETLQDLSDPNRELFLIIGADQADNFPTWYDADRIPEFATVHVIPRAVHLSSTYIRIRIKEGRTLKGLVPDPVITYIERAQLYERSAP